ncbi:adenosine deaminase [Oceanisphaera psychrotolerans]|uniref:Adenosine deaminase n=1 Tax=Oceanisphaera psychrotolerans TaxID=1414654 RepID=A0A1J4QK31_9GAMM|nr:adenosine deaminase [Oceanisphaera psychrotolerans]OIN14318.1 adenosine deaminase [Oceanisphaera psychrotolerans]
MIDPSLPLLDLHRHLDGNIRPATILELGQSFNMTLPATTLGGLRPHVQVLDNAPDLMSFLAKLDWGVKVLGSYDACRRIAYENIEDLQNAGIDYAELRFSPGYMAMSHRLDPQGVVEAVIDGVAAGSRDFGIPVKLIGIMSRTFGQQACEQELAACLAHRDKLVAMDLAGDELGFPGDLFEDHFRRVRHAGLHVTVHAGEAAGSDSIWQAIRELGAERIGHGVKAVEDDTLLDYLAERRIGIETCLTSNLQTSTVAELHHHPIHRFLDRGIAVCLNTDDPAVEGIELRHEYTDAAAKAGLTAAQTRQCQENALEMAFISAEEKAALLLASAERE